MDLRPLLTMNLRSLLLCSAALLTACGGGDAPAASDAAADHDTFGGGPAGGMLVVMADREPDHLNPVTFNSQPAYQAVHLMFRALAVRDSTLSGYAPDLARAWRFESDSVLILELRDDVLWHDGTPVTADDVVFTIEMQRNPETGSPRQGDVAAVTNAVARDSVTVAVTLARNSLYTVNALLEVVPVPRHLLGDVSAADFCNAPFGRNPVGNGFYRFVGWTAGQNLTLAADAAKPDGRAAIDRIVMRFIPDVNASMTELLTGQGDLIPKLPTSQRDRLASSPDAQVYGGPRIRPTWIALNTRRSPFDDVRVRRAIAMAVDRDAIVRGLFGDIGEVAWSPIPPALREHSPDVRPIAFDTAGARRLLAEAGWRDTNGDGILDRNGRPLRFEIEFISSDQTRQDVLVAMQAMLRRVGIDMAPRAWESSTWVSRLRDGSFTASFWGWGWGPGVVGPNAEMIFHSKSVPPNGPNFAASRNPRIDQLIDAAIVATDTAQARTVWRELEQLMIDDAVYLPIYMDPELFGVHARFRNVKFRGIEWVEDAPYWYIDTADRLPRDRGR
ncbi:MAG TPA: ABC transporter substrate-binding protein [Longimicrobiales bacterium]|nr:ABC transporter substrate-binding protein [Longimicrobiales bacterium]